MDVRPSRIQGQHCDLAIWDGNKHVCISMSTSEVWHLAVALLSQINEDVDEALRETRDTQE